MLVLSDRGAGGMRGGAFAADGWEAACGASVYVPSVGVMGAWHDGRMDAVFALRRQLSLKLRDGVAGPDAERARARIWDSPGPRWFDENDPLWIVHADASMFIGGLASLLLQSLHPLAMAGVAQHSGYRSDPWGRLQRTSHYIATTSFGTIEHAEAMIAAVRRIHETVTGTFEATPYRAGDPDLLRWVHVAETFCFARAHQLYGHVHLDAAQYDTYVDQARHSAQLLGVTRAPTTMGAILEQLTTYRPALHATRDCLDAQHFLLRDPPLPRGARPGYSLLVRGAVAVLPSWARSELQLHSRPGDERLGRVGTAAIRWVMAA